MRKRFLYGTVLAVSVLMVAVVFAQAYPSGMVSYWKLNEGSGTVAGDSVGGNNGNLINGPAWTMGQVGGALSFDGVNDYIDLGNPASLYNVELGSFSHIAWIKTGVSGIYQPIYSNRNTYGWYPGNGVLVELSVSETGKLQWILACSNDLLNPFAEGDSIINDNEWHLVAGTKNSSGAYLWVDGIVDKQIYSGDLGDCRRSNLKWIGGRRDGINPPKYFKGSIDEVAVFNRDLTQDEIQQYYWNGLNGLGYEDQPVNKVSVKLGDLKGSWTELDSVENVPREYRSNWHMHIFNGEDESHQSIINPQVILTSSLDLAHFHPDNPEVFTAQPDLDLYTWDFDGYEVPEFWSLGTGATEHENIVLETPGFSASRTVSPEILTEELTLQTVTVNLLLEEPLPAGVNHYVVLVGTEKQVYNELPLIDTEVVSQNEVDGWTTRVPTLYEARWEMNAPNLPEVGVPYTFEVTFLTNKSELLLGSPIFKPWVLIMHMENVQQQQVTSNSVTLVHSAVASATFTADNIVTWEPGIERSHRDFSFQRIISDIGGGGEEPPYVIVDTTVDIDPDTLNLNSNGVFTAYLTPPEGYSAEDFNTGTISCEGADVVRTSIEDGILVAKFKRQDLEGIDIGDEVEMRISGKLNDDTRFKGSDTIRVIEKGKKK